MNAFEEQLKAKYSNLKSKRSGVSVVGSIAEVSISGADEKHTVAKYDLLKSNYKTISPKIFTKAKPAKNSKSDMTQRIYVFENLLSVVVQAYYKCNYTIESICYEIKSEPVKFVSFKGRKTKDKHRKAIHKLHKTEPKADSRRLRDHSDDATGQNLYDGKGILDYLVSPLKVDYEFGQLIRELVDQRDCHIRVRDMRLRETL